MTIKERVHEMSEVIKGFVDRKLGPVETEVGRLKALEETHFATIEALMRRIEALERRSGEKSPAVRLLKADDR